MRIGYGTTSGGTTEGAAVHHEVPMVTPVVHEPADAVTQVVVAHNVLRTRCRERDLHILLISNDNRFAEEQTYLCTYNNICLFNCFI